jgi:alkylation response protein AidB-like acyl-CoA dehydrogenase
MNIAVPDNEDHAALEAFRSMVLRFLEREALPHYDQWEREKLIPRSFWRTMGAAGLLLPDLPEEYGTAGTPVDVPLMIMEEMCRLNMHALANGYSIHSNIVGPYISNIGSEAQRRQWLPRMVTGEVFTALAMTEPGGGSDTAAMRTFARRDGDHYVINGSKTFITNGHQADLIVLCCKTDMNAGAKGISLFLVEADTPGFKRGKRIDKIGQHASDTSELFFDDVRVPASAMLGVEGRGFIHMMEELPRERLGCSVQAVGHMQGALDLTVDYVKQRHAFGAPLSRLQNTRFKLAQCRAKIELGRALFEKCLAKFKAGGMTVEDAALLKYSTTEMELEVINECLQHFGGYGYTDEYPISRFYRDARIQTIYAGTSEIMLEVIARGILGR